MHEVAMKGGYRSRGSGEFRPEDLRAIGSNVVIEPGVLVFHPDHVELGSNVYIGHRTILEAYHQNLMVIGDGTWVGSGCFFHSAGGITIGQAVGIGPGVKILTSEHEPTNTGRPVILSPLRFAPVVIEDGADIGVGAILMPGVTIGVGAIVGAGAVVTRDVLPGVIAMGVPARAQRVRPRLTERDDLPQGGRRD